VGKELSIITALHQETKRDCLARMNDDKVACMRVAKEYGFDYWDGARRYGYGGYKYIPDRWTLVAEALIEYYQLSNESKLLDVGCGKGFLLYELYQILPGLRIYGFDVSDYALTNLHPKLKGSFLRHDARHPFPYEDAEFDLVISLGCLHNLSVSDLQIPLTEIGRVGRRSYVMVESYRTDQELFNLQCWALTAQTFLAKADWEWLFRNFRFSGDFEFIYF
jgi:SAM-dependent methyltransferase